MSNRDSQLRLLEQFRTGELTAAALLDQLRPAPPSDSLRTEVIDGVQVDLGRATRCGFPEAVYGPGKPAEMITEVFSRLQAAGQPCLATRLDDTQAEHLRATFTDGIWNAAARTFRLLAPVQQPVTGNVAVITAGSSDRPVAEEAAETLAWMQIGCELITDIGVAGPQRLLQNKHRFEQAGAVVVVAGMEAALPSVVAGWVACPVIGVPTSVGYGAHLGGITALLSMLNSCAANVAVVNIDAGFKGGYLAGMIARGNPLAGDAP